MRNKEKSKKNIEKKICSVVLSSLMIFGTCGSVFGETIDKIPNIPNNSLVIGKHLFELDKVTSSEYNLNSFVEAAKTVDDNNGVYYKYNGKWYTGKDIESFANLKKAKGVDNIPNDISKIDEKDVKEFMNSLVLDWYQDGDFSHDEDGKNESVEQFVVYFNKPVKQDKGKLKLIVPNQNGKDPYGKDKFGIIECSMNGASKPQSLEKIKGGAPATLFVIKDKGKKDVPAGYTDRVVIELTEDWTRILNTKETGINYYDDVLKGLRLVGEGLEDETGKKIESVKSKRDINLVKDDQKPRVVTQKPIYTQIGENGIQAAGKTRIMLNEPVQIFTKSNVEDLKKLNKKQPYVVGSFARDRYIQYNPITPNQEQLKSENQGVPVFETEYRKIDNKGNPVLDKDGKEIMVKGMYAKRGDVFESNEGIEENGDKIKLRLNNIDFKYDFDDNNKGITRFRDYGAVLISPRECLTVGKWQLVVKNLSDDAGNKMDDYVSNPIEIKQYFDVKELTPNKIKIKFREPFKRNSLWGNKIPIVVTNDVGKAYGVTWISNIKEGQTDAEAKFAKPMKNIEGTVYVNTIECTVNENTKPDDETEKPTEPKTKVMYKDGVYEGGGDGLKSKIKVSVTVKNGKMSKIDVIEQNDTPSFFERAKAVISRIIDGQSTDVEGVTGATYSSEGIKEAVKNALEKAKISEDADKKDDGNRDEQNDKDAVDEKKINYKMEWYQDGNYNSDKEGANASVEQFMVKFNKPINPKKGTLKIIVPDKTKQDPYGEGKLGEIEIKMNGISREKALTNIKGGDMVGCIINSDNTYNPTKPVNKFMLELTQDWQCILNTEKTNIHYYDDRISGLRLVGEGLEDAEGNVIEDKEGNGKITCDKDIVLKQDTIKPHVVAEKLIYDKIGSNGVQKAGNLGVVFNEPIQLYTDKMDQNGIIPPVVYRDNNPLTPNPSQIGKYENFLPELKANFEKVDERGNVLKDKEGNPIVVKGKYDLMSDVLDANDNHNETSANISMKRDEIPFNFNLDSETSGINRFRDYGLFYINPETNLSQGKWRLVLSGVSDDAGNEMDKYISEPFDIKPLFEVENLTKDGVKIKFTESFSKKDIGSNSLVLVVTKNGEIVNSAELRNLKEGQTEAEVNFPKPIENFKGEYLVNNIKF